MTAQPTETPTEPAAATDPAPTGSPVGHLEPEKALATWRAMERSSPTRLDVGMLWASRSEDMKADAVRAPVFGDRRWLVTLLPPADVLAGFEALGGTPAEAWLSLAGPGARLLVWSYRPRTRPTMLDLEAHEADGLFGFSTDPELLSRQMLRWVTEGPSADGIRRPTAWRRVDDHGVRMLLHRLAMFCMGDAVARPLRA